MGLNTFLDSMSYGLVVEDEGILLIPPPAISPMMATTVEVEVIGLAPDVPTQLVIFQHSAAISERSLSGTEIASGKVSIDLPPIPEGIVTFLLLAKLHGNEPIFQTALCCVVPPVIVADIERMFLKMCTLATESSDLPEHVTDEQTRMVWVWKEHFSPFLEDIEVLFECAEASEDEKLTLMNILTNMLRHCCMYDAWEFSAYVLTKAVERGVQIKPNPFNGTNKITAESLKAAVYAPREVCSRECRFEEMNRRH